MAEKKEFNELQVSSRSRLIARYFAFVGMFVGAGFISGSIVHLGEGINPWDVSVLVVGVLFFLTSTFVQEFVFSNKNFKEAKVLQFLAYLLVLSVGVGMASGGTQHFVDTPIYSSYLIPIGLGLGVIAFFLKEKERFVSKQWFQIVGTVFIMTIVLIWLLGLIGKNLPESLLHQKGHSHSSQNTDIAEESAHGH